MRSRSIRSASPFTAATCILFLALAQTSTAPAPAAAGDSVVLCHVPPGNPENRKTIEVGGAAVPAHLAHGDEIGACLEEPEASCGDGILQVGEECDDGNDNPFDGCDECIVVDTTPD
jgi:cysteine-rich repeat protein